MKVAKDISLAKCCFLFTNKDVYNKFNRHDTAIPRDIDAH